MRILLLDIESAPNLVHCWGLFQQNVSINQIMASGYVLCWAAKWRDDNEVMFDSINKSGSSRMLKRIHALLEKADAVITYNGQSFDIPTLNKEFVLKGMTPPSPYKSIDLYQTAKRVFRFPSNKLEYIARSLKLGGKVQHEGHELWIKTMAGDPEAWQRMEEYNKQDVVLLDKLYTVMLPWIPNHPNIPLHNGSSLACHNCGGFSLQRRGYAFTNINRFVRLRCNDCGSWLREPYADTTTEERKAQMRRAA